jgi:hypothetical protein
MRTATLKVSSFHISLKKAATIISLLFLFVAAMVSFTPAYWVGLALIAVFAIAFASRSTACSSVSNTNQATIKGYTCADGGTFREETELQRRPFRAVVSDGGSFERSKSAQR